MRGSPGVRVKLWTGEELELRAKNLKELLLCLRKLKGLERYIKEDGSPKAILLVFVDGIERSALKGEEFRGGELVELFPVLHRG